MSGVGQLHVTEYDSDGEYLDEYNASETHMRSLFSDLERSGWEPVVGDWSEAEAYFEFENSDGGSWAFQIERV